MVFFESIIPPNMTNEEEELRHSQEATVVAADEQP
jgi:hypothetical protein